MMRFALAAVLALAATPSFAMELTSPDVTEGGTFATKFICAKFGGNSTSPALSWTGVPAAAKSLAVTMFDPDAGTAGFWHWAAADIPPASTGLEQGAGAPGKMPAGTTQLPNGAKQASYAGPCPPPGKPHHYQITVYALPDAKAGVTTSMTAADIGAWLDKNAIDKARITPIYEAK
jgi:Raf kinase inhibitor-like YbhB/YbcL family protein